MKSINEDRLKYIKERVHVPNDLTFKIWYKWYKSYIDYGMLSDGISNIIKEYINEENSETNRYNILSRIRFFLQEKGINNFALEIKASENGIEFYLPSSASLEMHEFFENLFDNKL